MSARAVALDVLRRVVEQGAYSNLALSAALERSRLSERDRRLAAELLYGTLRRLPALDRAVDAAAGRSGTAIDPHARAALRLGAYQLLFSRIPPHAAVSATVDLAPLRARGFVNAVLRRLSIEPPPDPPAGDGDRAVSIRTGVASWQVAELRHLLPAAEVEPAATALTEHASLGLRVNTCRSTAGELSAALVLEGFDPIPGRHHPDVLTVPSATPSRLPGYREGWFAVQDEASVLVAAAMEGSPGARLLDACAGPGGKAAHLACLVRPDGVVVAADASPGRAGLVRRAARRLGVRVLTLAADARFPAVAGPFDGVLVDAPCSGLGAARRRPELLWRPERQALSGLARLQVAILLGVAGLVRPGGRLVYSVCTFPRAETDAVLRSFLAERRDFEPALVPGPDGRASSHRLWPHRHGTDAMFYAGLRRAEGPPL